MTKLALFSGFIIAATPAFAEIPVRAVTLFEAGLAEITRVSEADQRDTDAPAPQTDDPSFNLTVPVTQVDDILKSLRIGGDVTSARVRLDGAAPLEDAFAQLPFGPGDIGELAALLDATRGTLVVVEGPTGFTPVSGRVMGVTRPICGADLTCPVALLLRSEEGLRSVELDASHRVVLADQDLQDRIDTALDVLSDSTGDAERTLLIETEGEGPVSLSYVIPAPIWRTAYRVATGEDGEIRLQAWAVLENVTGADWDDVRLTLSSGRPNALEADLTTRDWGSRDAYEGAPRLERPVINAAERDWLVERLVEPMAALDPGTQTADRGLDSRFTFPDPVSLDHGEMISLPFLSEELPVAQTRLWRGQHHDQSGNPDLVLQVENPLPIRLPAGIMTVSDETGYLGDAAFPVLVPGAIAEVAFGADQRVQIQEDVSEQSIERRVTVSGGVVRITQRWVRSTEYDISTPSGSVPPLTILHPSQQGWDLTETVPLLEPSTDPSRTDNAGFHRFELPAGTESFRVEEERPHIEVLQITDLSLGRLTRLLTDEVGRTDRDQLQRILLVMQEARRIQADMNQLADERERLVEDQDRSVGIMESSPSDTPMWERFRDAVMDLEDQIVGADRRMADLIRAYRAAQEDLDTLLAD